MKKTTRNYFWILAANFLLLLAVSVIWQYKVVAVKAGPTAVPGMIIVDPNPIPDVAYRADLKNAASLHNDKGQWLVVNLWASWCGPCIVEMPSLQQFADDYKGRGLKVIAISLDVDAPTVARAIKTHNFGPFANNWDDTGAVMKAFDPPAMPMTYILDPSGAIRVVIAGQQDWANPALRQVIDSLIKS